MRRIGIQDNIEGVVLWLSKLEFNWKHGIIRRTILSREYEVHIYFVDFR